MGVSDSGRVFARIVGTRWPCSSSQMGEVHCTLLGKAKRSRWMQLVTRAESRNAAVRAVLHAGWSIGRRHLLANTELREARATAKPDRFLGRHWQLLLSSVPPLVGAMLVFLRARARGISCSGPPSGSCCPIAVRKVLYKAGLIDPFGHGR